MHLRGKTRIGAGAHIDVGCVLRDVRVAAGARLKPYTVASAERDRRRRADRPVLAPAARVAARPRRRTSATSSRPRRRASAAAPRPTTSRTSATAIIGEGANVGAGTIFCNYDGFEKHTTVIEDGAFIGSDSQLVAPVDHRQGRLRGDRHDGDEGRTARRSRRSAARGRRTRPASRCGCAKSSRPKRLG